MHHRESSVMGYVIIKKKPSQYIPPQHWKFSFKSSCYITFSRLTSTSCARWHSANFLSTKTSISLAEHTLSVSTMAVDRTARIINYLSLRTTTVGTHRDKMSGESCQGLFELLSITRCECLSDLERVIGRWRGINIFQSLQRLKDWREHERESKETVCQSGRFQQIGDL